MARQTLGQKAERVLKLLLGIRDPRVAAALVAHGFTEEDLEDGWRLLAALTPVPQRVEPAPERPPGVEAIDAFENTWFPIVRAALRHRFPDVAAALFLNLSQASGMRAAVTVGTFLERLRQMAGEEGPFAANGAAARKLLTERGLTPALEKETQGRVDGLASFRPLPQPEPSEEQHVAEAALWAWYLEWATVVRVAIREEPLLRALGLRERRAPSGDGSRSRSAPSVEAASSELREHVVYESTPGAFARFRAGATAAWLDFETALAPARDRWLGRVARQGTP